MAEDTNATKMEATISNPTTPASESSEEPEVVYAPRGSICDVRNLYQTQPDENGETSWTKNLPETLVEPVENSESAQYAMIVRNIKCYDGRKSFSVDSVVVQSEPLKTFLGKILDGYPGVTTSLERLELTHPFKPLIHRWDNLVKAREVEELDPTTKEHLELFHNVFEEELKDTLARKEDLVHNGVITDSLIWTLFEPGDVIITNSGTPRGYRFSDATKSSSGEWVLACRYIDFDGEKFGYKDEEFIVDAFIGTKPIASLSVFPLKYHPDRDAACKTLIARGKRWEEHKGYHYRQYEGLAIGTSDFGPPGQFHVKSRIIIDAEAFGVFHSHKAFGAFHSHGAIRLKGSKKIRKELTDDQRMITSDMVYGYSLNDKEWMEFSIQNVSEIKWDSFAFESLVLPREQQGLKDLLLAIAKAQSKQLDGFDDVVRGKGRGIILQLSGPPGVGKTLTAESVAEVMKVPLYVMSAGDLGTRADAVEHSLKNNLRMIPKWGAVLLLDEAEVFMEARSPTDLERNELVSIFLRMLEYYEGILFLTTNRAENIDPAFESRIHLSLNYKELDATSRRHIWSQLLSRSPNTAVFSDEQLDQLAVSHLDGRQIKNTIKTASLLAWSQQGELGFEHVQVMLNLRKSNTLKMN
ncbi:putative AAA family ATPase [Penicillium brasilianum]|uniref:Putative AAA family ATPase n=1 Tax=Penicillium brasilianum TaxID=104259 RepID=A0A1S9RXA9_PENBI|nr:putative AAA family ATPase [Penicillium brasilianum]